METAESTAIAVLFPVMDSPSRPNGREMAIVAITAAAG